MSILLLAFSSTETFAQRHLRKVKYKKSKHISPVKYYNKYPKRGAQVKVLPQSAVLLKHAGSNYYFNSGIFYKSYNKRFVVTAPPIGIRVSILPANPFKILHSGRKYYYHYGTYYMPVKNGKYEVVAAPVGARVDALPNGFEMFELDGMVYYRLNQTYYKAIATSNGNVIYEVVRV